MKTKKRLLQGVVPPAGGVNKRRSRRVVGQVAVPPAKGRAELRRRVERKMWKAWTGFTNALVCKRPSKEVLRYSDMFYTLVKKWRALNAKKRKRTGGGNSDSTTVKP